MHITDDEIKALKSMNEGADSINPDILISLKNKGLITGLKDTTTFSGESYIIGLDTELTNLGLEAIN